MGRRRTNSFHWLVDHVSLSWSVIGPMLHLIRLRLRIHLRSTQYQGHVGQMVLPPVQQAIRQLPFDRSASKYSQFHPNGPIFVELFLRYQSTLYFHLQMNFLINQLLLLVLFVFQFDRDRKWATGSWFRSVHIENDGRNEELLLTYFCARMIKQIKHAFYVLWLRLCQHHLTPRDPQGGQQRCGGPNGPCGTPQKYKSDIYLY